jgi:hypothetical protein
MISENRPYSLPFSLTNETLMDLELMYGLYSSKTGAGVEELYVHGSGRVVLRRTAARDAPAEIVEGTMPVFVLPHLLYLMDDQRFLGMDDAEPPNAPGLRRILRMRWLGQSKMVAADDYGSVQFERIVSALELAASLAVPEVQGRRFFTLMGPI